MRKSMEEVDMGAINEETQPSFEEEVERPVTKGNKKNVAVADSTKLVNCLRPVRVQVKFIKKSNGVVKDPKHALFGGMAETSTKSFSCPITAKGVYQDVLTKDEKAFLENVMQLPEGALSVFNKTDNFWDTFYVELHKESNFFDLSDPMDYIRVKVLKASKNIIAPSISEYQSMPKPTYKFIIVEEGEEDAQIVRKTSVIQNCWKEYGKIEEQRDKLQFLVESMENGRPMGKQSLVWLQSKATEYITNDASTFLSLMKDPLLDYKVLLQQAVKVGVVGKKGNYYYLDGTPICDNGEEPKLGVAAKYLSLPEHQPMMLAIKSKVNKND